MMRAAETADLKAATMAAKRVLMKAVMKVEQKVY